MEPQLRINNIGRPFMKRMLLALVLLVMSSFALAVVNINTASKQELEALPGVGPVKAQAIIDYRKANGAFKSVEDIDKVKGIGDKTFERLKGAISVSGASSAPANAAAPAAPAKMEPAKTAGPAPAAAKSESTKAAVPASAAPIRSDDKKSAAEDKATKAKADKDVKAKEKTDQSAMAKTVDKDAKSKDKSAKDSKSKDAKSRDAKDKEETPKK